MWYDISFCIAATQKWIAVCRGIMKVLSPGQVLPVPSAERRCRVGPFAVLLCHSHSPGFIHRPVWAGRLRPWRAGQRLHQRPPLRSQPDQRAGGKGHRPASQLQVSRTFHCANHLDLTYSYDVDKTCKCVQIETDNRWLVYTRNNFVLCVWIPVCLNIKFIQCRCLQLYKQNISTKEKAVTLSALDPFQSFLIV